MTQRDSRRNRESENNSAGGGENSGISADQDYMREGAEDRLLEGTESSGDRYAELDLWPVGRILAGLVDSNRRALVAVERALPQLEAATEALVERLAGGGRLTYVGAGTSGRLALQDAAELGPTFDFHRTEVFLAGGADAGAKAREGAEDDTTAARRAVRGAALSANDALIGIAASGRTPFTVAALEVGRELGALTIGLANNPDTPLLKAAEYPVCLDTGPEMLAGSTRLGAGTAQKVALNALSTAALVRLGGAYRNLMVGMVQSNEKLRRRAVAIVAEATGVEESRARRALREAGGSIRVAIVTLRTGLDRTRAQELLSSHGNSVRDVLRELDEDEKCS